MSQMIFSNSTLDRIVQNEDGVDEFKLTIHGFIEFFLIFYY